LGFPKNEEVGIGAVQKCVYYSKNSFGEDVPNRLDKKVKITNIRVYGPETPLENSEKERKRGMLKF